MAEKLAAASGIARPAALARLRDIFLAGSRLPAPTGNTTLPFKPHQFISQGRSVYATLEAREQREMTLDGQYYAKAAPDGTPRLLFPVVFCRTCGQEYYKVLLDEAANEA